MRSYVILDCECLFLYFLKWFYIGYLCVGLKLSQSVFATSEVIIKTLLQPSVNDSLSQKGFAVKFSWQVPLTAKTDYNSKGIWFKGLYICIVLLK